MVQVVVPVVWRVKWGGRYQKNGIERLATNWHPPTTVYWQVLTLAVGLELKLELK
jgi:hypothetical protein